MPSHSRARRGRLKTALVAATALTLLGVAGISMAAVDDPAGTADTSARTLATEEELVKQRDEVFADLRSRTISGVEGFSVGINPDAGRLGVTLFSQNDGSAESISLDLGENVDLDVVTGDATPFAIARGGMPLEGLNRTVGCTAGFEVTIGGNRQGMVTAGHCFDSVIGAERQGFRVADVEFAGHSKSIATNDNNDYGLMTTINPAPGRQAAPQILQSDGTIRRVVNTTEPRVGQTICKDGITTDTTCGEVTLISTLAVFGESGGYPSHVVSGLFMSDACMEPGDSGGPAYVESGPDRALAVGINTGGSGTKTADGRTECFSKSGGTNISYHLSLDRIPAQVTFGLV